jgi:dipeptidyl aminopeptidase/acylaminoacyl peptidase
VSSAPASPADVMVVDATSGQLTRVTQVNPQAAAFATSQFRAITWKSTDGLDVEGMLWLPTDYKPGTKLPLVLSIHGGPAGVWTGLPRDQSRVHEPRLGGARAERARQLVVRRRAAAR